MFEDPEFREVFRSLNVNLHLGRTEPDPAHPTTPVLHFFGEMEAPSTSTMTGRVRMSVDNQIQWHFVSCDHSFIFTTKCLIFCNRFLVIKAILSGTVRVFKLVVWVLRLEFWDLGQRYSMI